MHSITQAGGLALAEGLSNLSHALCPLQCLHSKTSAAYLQNTASGHPFRACPTSAEMGYTGTSVSAVIPDDLSSSVEGALPEGSAPPGMQLEQPATWPPSEQLRPRPTSCLCSCFPQRSPGLRSRQRPHPAAEQFLQGPGCQTRGPSPPVDRTGCLSCRCIRLVSLSYCL